MAIVADNKNEEGKCEKNDDEISDVQLVELLEESDRAQGEVADDDVLLCGVCEEDQEEVMQPRVLRDPKKPTLKDREEHKCLHWPFRSWCRDCMRGRGMHDQHTSKKKKNGGVDEAREVPTISIDFIFPGTEQLSARKNAQLVMFDNESEAIWAYRTGRKHNPAWLVPTMMQDLEEAGYGSCRICVRSDQENIIKNIKKELIEQRTGPTVPQESPVKESQCNGKMEKAIQNLEGQMRTLRCAIESETGVWVHPRSRMYNYMLHWACSILTRYRVTSWGRTPFQTLTGHQCSRPIAPFGTSVLWKEVLKGTERKKGDTDWHKGIFLGIRWRTSEVIVGTSNGVILCRTMRIDPEADKLSEDDMNNIQNSVMEVIYSRSHDENEPNDAEVEEGSVSGDKDEDDVAKFFGDFSDEEGKNQHDAGDSDIVDVNIDGDHRVMYGPQPVRHADGDMRRYGTVSKKVSTGGSRQQQKTTDERPDRDIRDYRAHQRLRRPRPPRAPAASTDPVVEKPDRMLTEWLRPPKGMNSLEVDMTAENARRETWEAAIAISNIRHEEDNEVLAKILRGVDVTEVYSRPRGARACVKSGMIGGSSMDLRTG